MTDAPVLKGRSGVKKQKKEKKEKKEKKGKKEKKRKKRNGKELIPEPEGIVQREKT